MITEYIFDKISRAHYKILEDGNYFGEIPGLKGVWSSGKSLEACRRELREVLEEWLVLKLKDGDQVLGLKVKSNKTKQKIIVSDFAYA